MNAAVLAFKKTKQTESIFTFEELNTAFFSCGHVLLPTGFTLARVPQYTRNDTQLMSPCALAGRLNVVITNQIGLLKGDRKTVRNCTYYHTKYSVVET